MKLILLLVLFFGLLCYQVSSDPECQKCLGCMSCCRSCTGPNQDGCTWGAKEIISSASGGAALRGIYVSRQEDKMLQRRSFAIEVVGDIPIFASTLPQKDYSKEFSEKKSSDNFIEKVNQYGASIAADAHISSSFFSAAAGFSVSNDNDNYENRISKKNTEYFSSIKCSNIPMRSIELSPENTKLRSAVIEKLLYIENNLNNISEGENEHFESFFETYGSHVLHNLVELGGTILKKAETTIEGNDNINDIKKAVRHKSEIYAEASGGFSGVSGGASFNYNSYETNEENTEQSDSQSTSHIRVSQEKRGGSAGMDNIPEWKMTLEPKSETWVIVDRPEPQKFTPIWELLTLHHSENFINATRMSKLMEEEWKYINKEKFEEQQKYHTMKDLLELELEFNFLGISQRTSKLRQKILIEMLRKGKVVGEKHSRFASIDTIPGGNAVLLSALKEEPVDPEAALLKFDNIRYIPKAPVTVYLKLEHDGHYLGHIFIDLDGYEKYPRLVDNMMKLMTGDNDNAVSWATGGGAQFDRVDLFGTPGELPAVEGFRDHNGRLNKHSLHLVEDNVGPKTEVMQGQLRNMEAHSSSFYFITRSKPGTYWPNPVMGHITHGLDVLREAIARGQDYVKAIRFTECGVVLMP